MLTLIKGSDTKYISENSLLLDVLVAAGWEIKKEEKEVDNGKSGKSSSKSKLSVGAE
jgi:hypothetical protein